MEKLPSDRIKDLVEMHCRRKIEHERVKMLEFGKMPIVHDRFPKTYDWIEAILHYLDEEHRQKQKEKTKCQEK